MYQNLMDHCIINIVNVSKNMEKIIIMIGTCAKEQIVYKKIIVFNRIRSGLVYKRKE